MKNLIVSVVMSASVLSASAYKLHENKSSVGSRPGNTLQTRAAGCSPAQAAVVMDFNNVSALLAQGGLNFLERGQGRAAYIVPKESDVKAIYGASLWMGGKDFNDQLKLAAVIEYRTNGEDFWPGPLKPEVATVEESVCTEYDRFYYANRAVCVDFHKNWLATGSVSSIPTDFVNWPAFGPDGQPLAPFYDADGSGDYDPSLGDMPWYQIKKTDTELPCGNDRRVTLYGDQTYWWVFNDKGNIHTETGGEPIGMEIHGQAFAFNTSDEVNDMTFYNYELINRSTQTLYETFFGHFMDVDLGFFRDDYAGCDVQRGLAYMYNADAFDESVTGNNGYGENPPAIGIDYFQGPYQDKDLLDNPLTTNYTNAIDSGGIPYNGIGIGYSDGVVDNERFGMRKMTSYTGIGAPVAAMSDPNNAPQTYNYMIGLWQDGSPYYFGGNGYAGQPGVNTSIPVDYVFFYDSDPYFWATRGIDPGAGLRDSWTEANAGNTAGDRRLVQSSGPFTLEPGAYNNITLGVVYARTAGGDPFSSVTVLKRADDKAQALFDNCFKILEGPAAPDVTTQELDKEIILMLSNSPNSNNANEKYSEVDPFIILPETAPYNSASLTDEERDSIYRSYRFEGYLIYQLANDGVKSGDLLDPDKARIVAQVDVKNGTSKLINWENDPTTGFNTPSLMVDGEDKGIKHTFQFKTDAFTQENLVNHKSYYYMAVAYAFNEYKKYDPASSIDGQMKTYIQSRITSSGEEIPVIKVIPHIPAVENGGTTANSSYGDGPIITRIEGQGNGGLDMYLTSESESEILADGFAQYPKYYGGEGRGPIEVKVIDPLNVSDHTFRIKFHPGSSGSVDNASWTLYDLTTGDSVQSDKTIDVNNEQILPQYGISIAINNWKKIERYYDSDGNLTSTWYRSELIRTEISFAEQSKVWLSGVPDGEGNSEMNWIRAGTVNNTGNAAACEDAIFNDNVLNDDEQKFEKMLDGIIAPYQLCARSYNNPSEGYTCAPNTPVYYKYLNSLSGTSSGIKEFGTTSLRSIDIVITSDKSKWTRCPVFETTDQSAFAAVTGGEKQLIKMLPSRDKNGLKAGDPGYNAAEGEYSNGVYTPNGMSWFPGYVIDIESGVRLNVGFGEDSRYSVDNGKDMIWNPTATMYSGVGDPVWGGKHYLYIFGQTADNNNFSVSGQKVPKYDEGLTLLNNLAPPFASVQNNTWRSCSYVYIPMVNPGFEFENPSQIPCDVRMSLRVKKTYERYNTNGSSFALSDLTGATNSWYNVYEFSLGELASQTNDETLNDSILSLINIVPNPYYAYSQYERTKLDNRVKIVNLPDECTIRIYNISGQLIRTFTKSTNSITSVDWDLKNQKAVPIAGGVYLIHVEVPNVGERVIKWFGALRPTDYDNF